MAQQSGRRATYHNYHHAIHLPHSSKKSKSKRKRSTETTLHKREEPNRMVKYSSCHNHRIASDKHQAQLVKVHSDGKLLYRRHRKHKHSRSTLDHLDDKHYAHRKKRYLEDEVSDMDYDEGTDYNHVNTEHILNSVRREYQQQVDHVISKWNELLDRSQMESAKYRNMYHIERNRNKKLQQTVDLLRTKLKKYKNKDNENQIIIYDLQQQLAVLFDDLTEISTPSVTPRVSNHHSKQRRNSIHNAPLKLSLPVPTNHGYKKTRRRSQTSICHEPALRKDDMRDKVVKSRDYLKKVLDGIDDHAPDPNECLASNLSLSIKYKDKLFKNKSNDIKVHQSMRLQDFIHHLSDSININPNVVQIQHDTNMIDTHSKDAMNASLAQLNIDNFDTISVYIDYNKLLQDSDDDANVNENMNEMINKMKQYIQKQHDAKHMLLLKTSLDLLDENLLELQYKERLYAIIIDCVLRNDSNSLLELLSTKIAEIVKCQHVRLYFKWNNIVQVIYPQNTNIEQQIVINLHDDNYDNRSLLVDVINEYERNQYTECTTELMKCYQNPSQNNSNFNSLFNKQFHYNVNSTLIAPLLLKHQQLIGFIQLVNKENGNSFEFTDHDKKVLAPFMSILGIALQILYHSLPHDNIFGQLHVITRNRVHRGVSRRIPQNEIPKKPEINSLSTDDIRHNIISHNASPISHHLSTTSSANSQSTSLIHNGIHSSYTSSTAHIVHNEDKLTGRNTKRKRNESTLYFIQQQQAHNTMIVANPPDQQLVPPPTPTQIV